MTDARHPERWLNDRRLLRLSDAEHRSFINALVWSVSNRTDGRIEPGDVALIPSFREQSIPGLTPAGLWAHHDDYWLITDFDATQTTRTQLDGLDHKRHLDRERKARQRARERHQEPPLSRDMSRDVTQDVTRDTKARPGQARTGLDEQLPTDSQTNEPDPVTGQTCTDCGTRLYGPGQLETRLCGLCLREQVGKRKINNRKAER